MSKTRIVTQEQLNDGYWMSMRSPGSDIHSKRMDWDVVRNFKDGTYEVREQMPDIVDVKLLDENNTGVAWADGFYMIFPGEGVYLMFEDELFDSERYVNERRVELEHQPA